MYIAALPLSMMIYVLQNAKGSPSKSPRKTPMKSPVKRARRSVKRRKIVESGNEDDSGKSVI